MVDLLVDAYPKIYATSLVFNLKGESILYVILKKDLYGLMKYALLFYQKLVSDLQSIGFVLNPYDPCVDNIDVDGGQITVAWKVDDMFISHSNVIIVNKMINWLRSKYDGLSGKVYAGKMWVSRGLVHDFLGMTFDYSQSGYVKVTMFDYIAQILDDFPD